MYFIKYRTEKSFSKKGKNMEQQPSSPPQESPSAPPSAPNSEREPVKEQKKTKRPLTEKRILQLAAARAARKKKADERKQHAQRAESSRLVKDDGESANRYLEVLKSNSPDIDISKSEPKKKKRNTNDKP